MNKEIAHFFWHGELSKFEENCIQSFVDKGFLVNLWSYNNLSLDGVVSRNAREILPESDLSKYKTSHENVEGKNKEHANIAVFADVFRINLLCKEEGWWVDADCYCIKSSDDYKRLRGENPYLFCLEYFHVDVFGNSIFYMTKEIASLFKQELDAKLKLKNNTAKMFIDFGPFLMSEVCIKYKLFDGLFPSHIFYPVYWPNRSDLVIPSQAEKTKAEIKNCYAVHIWCSTLKELGYDKNNPPEGSMIHNLFNNYDISTDKLSEQLENNLIYHNRFIEINKLYNKLLDRQPDINGLREYVKSNKSLTEIENIILNSEEYKSK